METEFAWLIEAKAEDGPLYYCFDDGRMNKWTTDSTKAIRYARKQDAELVIRSYGPHGMMQHPEVQAVEHGWSAPGRDLR